MPTVPGGFQTATAYNDVTPNQGPSVSSIPPYLSKSQPNLTSYSSEHLSPELAGNPLATSTPPMLFSTMQDILLSKLTETQCIVQETSTTLAGGMVSQSVSGGYPPVTCTSQL